MSLKPLRVFQFSLSPCADHSPHSAQIPHRRHSIKKAKTPGETALVDKSLLISALKDGIESTNTPIQTPKVSYVSYKKSSSRVYHDDFSVNLARDQEQDSDEQSSRHDSLASSISSVDPINWLQSVMMRKMSKQRPSIRKILPQTLTKRPPSPSPSPKLREVLRRKSCHCSWCGGISKFEKQTLHVKPAPVIMKAAPVKIEEPELPNKSMEKELTKKMSRQNSRSSLVRKNSKISATTTRKRDNSFTNISGYKKMISGLSRTNSQNSSPEDGGSSARNEIEQPKSQEPPKRRGSRFLMEFLGKQASLGINQNHVDASPRRNSFNHPPTINLLNESGVHKETWVAEGSKIEASPQNKMSKNVLHGLNNDSHGTLHAGAVSPRKSNQTIASLGECQEGTTAIIRTENKDTVVSMSKVIKQGKTALRKIESNPVSRRPSLLVEPVREGDHEKGNIGNTINNGSIINNISIVVSPVQTNKETGSPGLKKLSPKFNKKPSRPVRKMKPLSISRGNSPRISPISMDNNAVDNIMKPILSPSTLKSPNKSLVKKGSTVSDKKKNLTSRNQSQPNILEQNIKESPAGAVKGVYLQKIESQLSKKIERVRNELSRNLLSMRATPTPRDNELMTGRDTQLGLLSAKNITARSRARDEGMYISLPGTPRTRNNGKEFIISSSRKEKSAMGIHNSQSIERSNQKMQGESKVIQRSGSMAKDASMEGLMKRYQPQRPKIKPLKIQ